LILAERSSFEGFQSAATTERSVKRTRSRLRKFNANLRKPRVRSQGGVSQYTAWTALVAARHNPRQTTEPHHQTAGIHNSWS
jgi:hypothetical protein